jgi:hypothetical protein
MVVTESGDIEHNERQKMNRVATRKQRAAALDGRLGLIAQFVGALLILGSIIAVVFSSNAGASSLSNGVVALTEGTGSVVASNPLASHQVISIVVGPNSTLDRSALEAAGFPSGAVAIKAIECADPGGLTSNLPKKPTDCEPLTVKTTIHIESNGSVYIPGYVIYALPDITDMGSSNGTACDDSDHQCVVGMFTNQNDFTKPHLFSGPFQVTAATTSGDGQQTGSTGQGASGNSSAGTVSAGVSVPPATLAFTGSPTLWPWLLGSGIVLLLVGTGLRLAKRRVQ